MADITVKSEKAPDPGKTRKEIIISKKSVLAQAVSTRVTPKK